ncbi:MAG: Bro-N domain-containing protein [Bacilli bacterium]|nr:Bro-N domain-containing protein [Bacilli bacterium]
MTTELKENQELVLFENSQIRRKEYNGEWYYSIVDIIRILTGSDRPEKYWNDLKVKLGKEGAFQLSEKIGRLKMTAKDGKMRGTDCANRETMFRIIQSIPSPNAEPFKLWFARLAEERIQEVIDPSLAIERARQTYLNKGYTDEWINARIKGIPVRTELTDEWKKRGATEPKEFAMLTDEISKGTFGITTSKHKSIKNISENQNLRDNMSPMELALTTLAEVTATELHRTNDSQGISELKIDAQESGEIASITRENIEQKLNKPVVTEKNAIDFKKSVQEIDYK